MTDRVQQNVFGETYDEDYHFAVEGRTIRPWKHLIDCVLSGSTGPEYKPRLTSEGWVVEAVDASNVIMVDTTLPATAFESYDSGHTSEIGLSKDRFGSLLQHTRYGKQSSDTVTLTGDRISMESHVSREMHGSTVNLSERRDLIDPDSIRERAELADLDLDIAVDLHPRTFINIVESIEQKYINLQAIESGIRFESMSDIGETVVDIEADVSGTVTDGYYSMSYMESIANALHSGKVDEITLRWNDEYPLFVDFTRDEQHSGTIMLAPRITPDNDD